MDSDFSQLKREFAGAIVLEDKERAISLALEALDNRGIDIPTLYESVLRPALTEISSDDKRQDITIWREHVRSAIVRTVLECCYPYVIRERENSGQPKKDKKVIIICPADEYHEIGARMAADYFTLCGYDAVFVGGNTPRADFLSALEAINPAYVGVSVSNYYNAVAAERTIKDIKEKSPELKVIVGGYAFNRDPGLYKKIGADLHISGLEDIRRLGGEEII